MIRPRAAREVSYYDPRNDRWYQAESFFGFSPTSAGVTVNSDTAMRLITVQNCVRMRAMTLARLPCHIMQRNGERKDKAVDFYLYDMLHKRPNSWMTATEFWAMAEAHICLRGNFYAYKIGIEGRPIIELIPLKPDAVREIKQNEDFSLTYKIQFGGENKFNAYGAMAGMPIQTLDIPQEKIMHIRGLTLDGVIGANPIEYARETVGLGMASTKFLARYFGKGMHPGAVIEHPLPLSAPAHKNLRENLKEKYEGLGKSHELMLIDEGMKISFPQINLVDAQYIEQMKLSEAQIAGLFRVPLMLINGGDKSPTYASAEQFMLFYQMFSIDAPVYEAAIWRDLLTPAERKKYYAKFNMGALVRGDMETRYKAYGTAIDKEFMNPDEVRELEDMNPREDGGGKEYRTRTSTVRQQQQRAEE